MKRVLVTGGSGFLASWIIRKLLEQGYQVRTTIRSPHKAENIYKMLNNEGIDTTNLSTVIADLTQSEGWHDAMKHIDAVIHTASPLGGNNHEDPSLIAIAKRGTEHVINSAIQAGVKKVVMTSSEAACYPEKSNRNPLINESFWTDLNNKSLTQYMRSKVISEKTAWDIINKQSTTQLVTILPGAIMGPFMNQQRSSTDQIIEMMFKKMPHTNAIFPIIDVRDLADLHILAMESEAANGHRFIAESNALTMPSIAKLLKSRYPEQNISSIIIPNFVVNILSRLNPQIKVLNTMIGLKYHRDNMKAQQILRWTPRSSEETILDTVKYMMQHRLL